MAGARKPRGLREALRKRNVKLAVYELPIAPLEQVREIKGELELAKQTVNAGEFLKAQQGNTEDVKAAIASAQQAVRELEKRYADCFYRVEFRGLPADEFDALVLLHPPTQDQLDDAARKQEEPPLWNEATFYPELLERCAITSELSAEEWVEELKTWPRAERAEIRRAALEANVRSFSSALSAPSFG